MYSLRALEIGANSQVNVVVKSASERQFILYSMRNRPGVDEIFLGINSYRLAANQHVYLYTKGYAD